MDRKTIKAAIEALRKERKRIAWDANCARLYQTGNEYQERSLARYIVLTEQIEALEAELKSPAVKITQGGMPWVEGNDNAKPRPPSK